MSNEVRESRRSSAIQIHWTPKLIIFLVLLILALIFALQNFEHVDLAILFWQIHIRLVWALLIFAVVGAILGWMLPKLRARSRR